MAPLAQPGPFDAGQPWWGLAPALLIGIGWILKPAEAFTITAMNLGAHAEENRTLSGTTR